MSLKNMKYIIAVIGVKTPEKHSFINKLQYGVDDENDRNIDFTKHKWVNVFQYKRNIEIREMTGREPIVDGYYININIALFFIDSRTHDSLTEMKGIYFKLSNFTRCNVFGVVETHEGNYSTVLYKYINSKENMSFIPHGGYYTKPKEIIELLTHHVVSL